MTTYGELADGALGAAVAGNRVLMGGGRFTDADEARNIVGGWYELLLALRSHTWALLDPNHLRTHLLTGPPDAEPRLDVTAVHTFKAIPALFPRIAQTPYPDADFAHPWITAARHLRAGEDLLATHLTAAGDPLSAFADRVADPAARRAALVRIAALTQSTLGMETLLGLRCADARVRWNDVQAWLPNHRRALDLAHRTCQLAQAQPPHRGLDDVPVNYHHIRTDSPLDELTDRIARISHASWTLTNRPDYAVATLRDLAALGLTVHAHAASAAGIDLGSRPPTDTHPALVTARAWQQLAADLHHYRAAGPPDPQIRTDVLAVGQLLEQVAPLWHPNPTAKVADPATRRLTATLNVASHATTDIAHWSKTQFTRLAASELVWIRAGDLPRELVTDDEHLTQARLAGRIVPVPPTRAAITIARFTAITQTATAAPEPSQPAPRAAAETAPAIERTSLHNDR